MLIFEVQYGKSTSTRTTAIREREKKFINHKQINNVTIKIINSCGRLPAWKTDLAGRPCKYKLYYSICNATKSNNKTKPI